MMRTGALLLPLGLLGLALLLHHAARQRGDCHSRGTQSQIALRHQVMLRLAAYRRFASRSQAGLAPLPRIKVRKERAFIPGRKKKVETGMCTPRLRPRIFWTAASLAMAAERGDAAMRRNTARRWSFPGTFHWTETNDRHGVPRNPDFAPSSPPGLGKRFRAFLCPLSRRGRRCVGGRRRRCFRGSGILWREDDCRLWR